jgi:hypothetical protein
MLKHYIGGALWLLLAPPAWAAGGAICAGLEIPGKQFIYFAGADFKRIKTASLELGRVELPQKRDIDFFVVVSPDLTPDIQVGGRDVAGELRPSGVVCRQAKIYRLDFQFGSVLPPGPFSVAFPVFSRKSDGQPTLSASQQVLSGAISRIWLSASMAGDNKIVLRNDGNQHASKMRFTELAPAQIYITSNRCDGVALNAGQSCEITFGIDRAATNINADLRADYSDSNDYLDMRLSVEPQGVRVFTINKFYE